MNIIRKHPLLFLSVVIFSISLAARYGIWDYANRDLKLLQTWYDYIYANGVTSLADGSFSNYPPAYLYLLWLFTLLSRWVGQVSAIKLIPTLFDLLSTYVIFLMARLRYKSDKPYFIAACFFAMPTILFNSTGWGQIDSLYTSFLLVCVYLLLNKNPFWALVAFGVAFSFKSQSVFLLPFLGILFLKGSIRWFHFLSVPAVYLILGLPAAMIGRSWWSIVSIYGGQVGQFRDLSRNAPNLYIFIPGTYYDSGLRIGLAIFVLVMLVWGWVNWRAKIKLSDRQIILMALAALTLVPFVLPKMHDRYFYPVDVFSMAAVIFAPEMWFVPLLYQIISGFSYSAFIMSAPKVLVMLAALINTTAVIFILRKQYSSLRE